MFEYGTFATTTTLGESVRAFIPHSLPPADPVLASECFDAPNRAAEMALARLAGVPDTTSRRVLPSLVGDPHPRRLGKLGQLLSKRRRRRGHRGGTRHRRDCQSGRRRSSSPTGLAESRAGQLPVYPFSNQITAPDYAAQAVILPGMESSKAVIPFSERTLTEPPCARRIDWVMAKPSPAPSERRCREASAR